MDTANTSGISGEKEEGDSITKIPVIEETKTSLDDTIERYLGDFGWKQFLHAFLVSFAWFFDAQQAFISVFTDAHPPISHCSSSNTSPDFPAKKTSIISEWSLECASSFITSLPASSFFMGSLAGGFLLSTLADSLLGRKNLLVLSCLIMSLSGVTTAFSPNLGTYSVLRFVTGFGRGAIGTCALVLSTELVGKRWRRQVGIVGFFCFTFGFLSLPLMAFINRNNSWRLLYLWTCVPGLAYSIIVHFLVRESPRWLYIRGRREEFVKTLESMTKREKGSSLTSSFIERGVDWDENITPRSAENLCSSMRTLASEKRWAFRRLLVVMGIGFGTGMVYYGMPLAVGSLAIHDLYLSVALNAFCELPASFVTLFLIGKFNRNDLVLAFALLSGACSVSCAVIVCKDTGNSTMAVVQIGLELVSFFSACTAFNVLLIYALELFPTCVRNSALSMLRQAVVFGGVFSPLVVAAGRKNKLYSYGVFGLTIGLSGMLVRCLPQTRGAAFCDTLDEQEENERADLLLNTGTGGRC